MEPGLPQCSQILLDIAQARSMMKLTRIVMFTTVDEASFRKIEQSLVEEEFAPDWFATLKYVQWHGETKDLRCPGVLLYLRADTSSGPT